MPLSSCAPVGIYDAVTSHTAEPTGVDRLIDRMWIAADIEPVIAKDYVPPWARGDFDYYQLTVCRSITSVGA